MSHSPSDLSVVLARIRTSVSQHSRHEWFDLHQTHYWPHKKGIRSRDDLRIALQHFHIKLNEPDFEAVYRKFPSTQAGSNSDGFDFRAFADVLFPPSTDRNPQQQIRDGRIVGAYDPRQDMQQRDAQDRGAGYHRESAGSGALYSTYPNNNNNNAATSPNSGHHANTTTLSPQRYAQQQQQQSQFHASHDTSATGGFYSTHPQLAQSLPSHSVSPKQLAAMPTLVQINDGHHSSESLRRSPHYAKPIDVMSMHQPKHKQRHSSASPNKQLHSDGKTKSPHFMQSTQASVMHRSHDAK